ncbi:hypothetical protein AJ80_05320 [Polytolypa hystricis UAMH7299]|uniref:Homologous-pairing protein 2 winged helix domain-containing protein n=1 Tax=Polytolypa hystricis (strain UAMH7299) TaxID=1447883 RepID=A0A2B7Y4I4_POLH7|nr:hypothetical protein AJ80_05320 [Polytolypa hystricis UAMH7299]
MAPRKEKAEKAEKATGADGTAMILDYLRQQKYRFSVVAAYRPYSAIDITANLHNKVTKGYTIKALKGLHERKEIEGRAAGKQLVYHAIQDPVEEITPEQLAAIDKEIEAQKEYIEGAKKREKCLKSELAVLSARVSTVDLHADVSNLEAEKESVVKNLVSLQAGSSKARVVSDDERLRVEKEWKVWERNVLVRKRICRELWEKCTEVLPEGTSKAELWESLGLEGKV